MRKTTERIGGYLLLLYFGGLLSVMGEPLAFRELHIRKGCRKRRVLGTARIDAKADRSVSVLHVTDAQLSKRLAVLGALDTVIVLMAAEAVPHRPNACIDLRRRPVGVTVVGDHTAEMAKPFVFVFDRSFEPVFAVKVHDDAALVKTVLAVKMRLYRK